MERRAVKSRRGHKPGESNDTLPCTVTNAGKPRNRSYWNRIRLHFINIKSSVLTIILVVSVVGLVSLQIASLVRDTNYDGTYHSSDFITSSRVLFNPLPTNLPITLVPAARDRVMLEAGYFQKPRVVGCYWQSEEFHKNKFSTLSSPITVERLNGNLQRPFSERPMSLSSEELREQLHLKDSDDYDENRSDEVEPGCVPQHDWQVHSFPSCNSIHEVGLSPAHLNTVDGSKQRITFVAHGFWRDVWGVHEYSSNETLALKTLRYEHDYTERNYDRHRRDAVAVERLTSSPHVVDIYAYCSNTGLFDFASGGDLEEALWYSSGQWTTTEKLVVAQQVAAAIADVHETEEGGYPAIAHTDITPAQFVYMESKGMYLLSDFNRCRFIFKNQTNGKLCEFFVGNNPGTFRSPEEFKYIGETEKVDVYSMGNIFYSLLTKLFPFEEMSSDKAQGLIIDGGRPPINATLTNSNDTSTKLLLEALQRSWAQDPNQRASARDTANFLFSELKKIDGVQFVKAR